MPENNDQFGLIVQGSDAFKLAQALYNSVTGKTEDLSKRFAENYRIIQGSVFQLHAKVEQMSAQWAVIEKNSNITVHHVNDNKETFSSLDRFKLYDSSQTSPIESITYECNLLIKLDGVDKPQPYKITVRMESKLAMHHKATDELGRSFLMRFIQGGAINVKIDYVDYVIARNMMSTIDAWVSSLEKMPERKIINALQKVSHRFSFYVGYAFFLISLLSCIYSVDSFAESLNSVQWLIKYGLASFGIIFTFFAIGRICGDYIERSIDRVLAMGLISINVGDRRILENAEKRNRSSLKMAIISTVFTIIYGVLGSLIASYIFLLIGFK